MHVRIQWVCCEHFSPAAGAAAVLGVAGCVDEGPPENRETWGGGQPPELLSGQSSETPAGRNGLWVRVGRLGLQSARTLEPTPWGWVGEPLWSKTAAVTKMDTTSPTTLTSEHVAA